MNGTPRVPAAESSHPPPARPADVSVGLGVDKLIQGDAATPAPSPSLTLKFRALRWSLVATDLLICGLVAMMLLTGPTPPGLGKISLCLIALMLAAWLSCLGFWLTYKGAKNAIATPETIPLEGNASSLPTMKNKDHVPAPQAPLPALPGNQSQNGNGRPPWLPSKPALRSTVLPSNRRPKV